MDQKKTEKKDENQNKKEEMIKFISFFEIF